MTSQCRYQWPQIWSVITKEQGTRRPRYPNSKRIMCVMTPFVFILVSWKYHIILLSLVCHIESPCVGQTRNVIPASWPTQGNNIYANVVRMRFHSQSISQPRSISTDTNHAVPEPWSTDNEGICSQKRKWNYATWEEHRKTYCPYSWQNTGYLIHVDQELKWQQPLHFVDCWHDLDMFRCRAALSEGRIQPSSAQL